MPGIRKVPDASPIHVVLSPPYALRRRPFSLQLALYILCKRASSYLAPAKHFLMSDNPD